MRYLWDAVKNRRNIRLHGVAFEDAARIFDGPTVEQVDERFDYNEVRIYAIGLVRGLEITVVYTDREKMKDASFQRGARQGTKGASTGRTSKVKAPRGTDWERLRRMSDREIRKGIADDPDTHATDKKFWKNARVVWPAPKQIVTMRLDADLLQWFRQQRGYQTRINAILRAYMSAHAAERA